MIGGCPSIRLLFGALTLFFLPYLPFLLFFFIFVDMPLLYSLLYVIRYACVTFSPLAFLLRPRRYLPFPVLLLFLLTSIFLSFSSLVSFTQRYQARSSKFYLFDSIKSFLLLLSAISPLPTLTHTLSSFFLPLFFSLVLPLLALSSFFSFPHPTY